MELDQFKDMLSQLLTPAEDTDTQTVYDDLVGGFSEQLDGTGAYNAKIQELENTVGALQAENNDLKLKMFDKLMATPADTEPDTGDDSDDSVADIDSLFE